MARPEVILDASCLVALVHERDALHDRAVDCLESLGRERAGLVCSDWVLSEFLAGASAPSNRRRAAEFVDRLSGASETLIVPATRRSFDDALSLYRSRPDKAWSLVHSSSMLFCRSRGIRRVFTHDRHFEQAGFKALLR